MLMDGEQTLVLAVEAVADSGFFKVWSFGGLLLAVFEFWISECRV